MKLTVKRTNFLEKCTIGHLSIDDADTGLFTLEPKVREEKIDGVTAIPPGNYSVILDFSQRFQRVLPHILNVPGFEGVRIHPGNSDVDTHGCILLGKSWEGGAFIGRSRDAFEGIFPNLQAAKEITMEIG